MFQGSEGGKRSEWNAAAVYYAVTQGIAGKGLLPRPTHEEQRSLAEQIKQRILHKHGDQVVVIAIYSGGQKH